MLLVPLFIFAVAALPAAKQSRLDTRLQELRDQPTLHGVAHLGSLAAGSTNGSSVRLTNSHVTITATGDGQNLLDALKLLGLENGARIGNVVSGQFPLVNLKGLDDIKSSVLRSVRADMARTRAGAVTSQGDRATFASDLRTRLGVDGTGITVGILSDSFNCLGGRAADIANGDLPSNTVILQEIASCAGASDEGRAMAQIVHDLAPGATIKFCSAFNGFVLFAQCIDLLVTTGCDVIVDDIFYFDEAYFQDDLVAQAADRAVAHGVAYFSAAGNEAKQSYESAFRNSGISSPSSQLYGGKMHDFNSGSGVDTAQRITISHSGSRYYSIILQWDEPYYRISGGAGSRSDVDICVMKTNGVARACSAVNNLGGDPVEILQFLLTESVDGRGTLSFDIVITLYAGPVPTKIKYVYLDSQISVIDYRTNSGTVVGHANAAGAMAVGAVSYRSTPRYGRSPPLIESFSSSGGTRVLFSSLDGSRLATPSDRTKPDISCVDGVDTTFFGGDTDSDGFPNFFGTSAAAPHAAAIAGLLLQVTPAASVAQIYSAMQTGAVNMAAAGFDYDTGFGLCNASASASQLCPSNCDDHNPCTADACGASGCVHTPVSASAGIVCRVSAGVCDVAETCNGSPTCPSDAKVPHGFACRASPPYPQVAMCSGSSVDCPCPRALPATIPSCPAKSYAFHTLDAGSFCVSFNRIKYAAHSTIRACPATVTFTPDPQLVSGTFKSCQIATDANGDVISFSFVSASSSRSPLRRATYAACGTLSRSHGGSTSTATSSSTGVFNPVATPAASSSRKSARRFH